jgi:hypothetical protein
VQSKFLLKLLVITSSLLLLAAFVGYRAGAFGWLAGSHAPANSSEFISTEDSSDNISIAPPDAEGTDAGKQIIYSTKSAPVFTESDAPTANTTPPPPPAGKGEQVIFSGTKALLPGPLPDPNPPPQTNAPPDAPPADNTIMVGPKSPGGF